MFWGTINAAEQRAIEAVGIRRSYAKGTVLFPEGGRPSHVLVLLQGLVKLTRASAAGKQVLIELRGPGALVGELSSIDDSGRSAAAIAITPIQAIIIPTDRFKELLRQDAGIAYAVLRIVAVKLREATDRRLSGTADVVGQLSGRLVELAGHGSTESNGSIMIQSPLTQEEMAEWIGVSRDAVVLALRKMRENDWIETARRTIHIKDLEALRDRSMQ